MELLDRTFIYNFFSLSFFHIFKHHNLIVWRHHTQTKRTARVFVCRRQSYEFYYLSHFYVCSVFTRSPYSGRSAHSIDADGVWWRKPKIESHRFNITVRENWWNAFLNGQDYFLSLCSLFFPGVQQSAAFCLHKVVFIICFFFLFANHSTVEREVQFHWKLWTESSGLHSWLREKKFCFFLIFSGIYWIVTVRFCGLCLVSFQVWVTSSASQSFVRCENSPTDIPLNQIDTSRHEICIECISFTLNDSRPSIN